jgi:hypothetical protein
MSRTMRCRSCGHFWTIAADEIRLRCPQCSSADTDADPSITTAAVDTASTCGSYVVVFVILLVIALVALVPYLLHAVAHLFLQSK